MAPAPASRARATGGKAALCACVWEQQPCFIPIYPDDSGYTTPDGEQTSILPSLLLSLMCSKIWLLSSFGLC